MYVFKSVLCLAEMLKYPCFCLRFDSSNHAFCNHRRENLNVGFFFSLFLLLPAYKLVLLHLHSKEFNGKQYIGRVGSTLVL